MTSQVFHYKEWGFNIFTLIDEKTTISSLSVLYERLYVLRRSFRNIDIFFCMVRSIAAYTVHIVRDEINTTQLGFLS